MSYTDSADKDETSIYTAQYWQDQLKTYKQEIENKWSDQRKNLDKLYSRDERSDAADREYSIFWANIEVLKPAVYARSPQPVVVPRFRDSNLIARAASDTLERCLVTTYSQSDLDGCLREVRDEFLRYGRGTARARLSTRDGAPSVEYDNFTAADFAHDPGRSWRDVTWVAFRAWLTKDKLKARFEKAAQDRKYSLESVPLKKRDLNRATNDPTDQAPVWEIWCKDSGKVHFVAEDFDTMLDEVDPWLSLSNFWPCPKPAYGTTVPNKLKPVPDIRQYKDQIEEINEYTARIAALSEKLRLQGFYPAGMGELSDAIEAAIKQTDNRATLVPISSWAQLGGAAPKDMVLWLPVDQVLELIKGLVELRRTLIDDVYQITGLSDIVRGASEGPRKTATEQQLKAQWGSVRIRERQNELARFARDMTRITGEIIAENFDHQTVAQMSQVQLPSLAQKQQIQMGLQNAQAQYAQAAQVAQQTGQQPPPPPSIPPQIKATLEKPAFEEVMQFLADDKARGFLIDIETDSTIQPDEDAEKQRRTEFITAVGGFLQQAFPIVQAAPSFGNFVGEALKFVSQGFRAGRPLEGAIDQLVEMIDQLAQQPQQQQPDPAAQAKVETAKIGQQTAQIKGQAETMKANADMAQTQMDMRKSALEHHQSVRELAMRAAMPQGPAQ